MTEHEKDARIRRLQQLNWVQVFGLVGMIVDRIVAAC